MATEVKPARTWADFRSKPTKAVPKRTLFGASLEINNKKDMQDIKSIDLDKVHVSEVRPTKGKQPKLKLSPQAKMKIPGQEILQHTQDQLEKQKERISRAEGMLHMLEEKSKYFKVGIQDDLHSQSESSAKPHQWMTEKDLQNVKDINNGGLNQRSNYNRQKYQARPPTHQYSLMGDILSTGMDSPVKRVENTFPGPVFPNRRHQGDPHQPPKETFLYSATPLSTFTAVPLGLPANIQHRFRTNVCKEVLSDSAKVLETLKRQEELKRILNRSRSNVPLKSSPSDDVDPVYASLSNSLRQNVFPGNTYNHKQSINHSVYTSNVYTSREPDPDEFRYQRDELSTWAEKNILRERVKKAWDVYLAETMKRDAA